MLALQNASNTSVTASVAASFGASPNNGNLLIAVVTASVGVGSISLSNSGWTAGPTASVGVAGGMAVFYKTATPGGADQTVTANATLATFMDIQIFEYSQVDDESPLDKTASTADSGSGVTSIASGTTATLTQANEIAFVAVAMAGSNGGSPTFTNSFNSELTTNHIITGDIQVTAATALSTTVGWATSQRATAVILTFLGETGDSYGIKVGLKPLAPVINWNHPLTKGLQSNFPFFIRGGTLPLDIVSKLQATSTQNISWVNDLFGPCISFNGSSSSISFTATPKNSGTPFSFESLIKPASVSANAAIIANQSDTGARGPEFRVNSSAQLELLEQSVVSIGYSTTTLTVNLWAHVVVTYDASGKYVFYINGRNAGSGNNLQSLSYTNWYIGQQPTNEWFNGLILYTRMWNRILTFQEVKQLYTNPWQIYNQPGLLTRPY
jgi:hypothetical protein